MKSRSPLRNSLWLVIAVMGFFAMAASSPQCASTDDQVLNPSFEPLAGPGNPCIDACNQESMTRKREEQIRHKAQIDFCNGVPECKQDEAILHDSIMTEINADKDACKAVCQHEQGAATGGQ